MKPASFTGLYGLTILLLLAGCTQGSNPFAARTSDTALIHTSSYQDSTSKSASGAPAASGYSDCGALATKRMAMYDTPSIYPVSPKERQQAYQALYAECTNGTTAQMAAASHNNVAQNSAMASEFANLSPAAGGSAAARPAGPAIAASAPYVTTSQVSGATVIVIGGKDSAGQLAALSPSAGEAPNTTVVLLQAQPAIQNGNHYIPSSRTAGNYMPPHFAGPLPVAVPIPPQASASAATPASVPFASAAAHYHPAPTQVPASASRAAAPTETAANQQLENVLEK